MPRHRIASAPIVSIARIGLWAALIGAVIGGFGASDTDFWLAVALGALTGAFIGLSAAITETYCLSNPRLRIARRLPPILVMALRAALYSVFIVVGLALPGLFNDEPALWHDPDFAQSFALSAVAAFVISTGVEITQLLGKEATIALVSGRYYRPRLEDRVILFADIVGSTPIAERIGELRFHDFLGEVTHDLAEPVDLARGDVYKYVGDALIVTWPLARGLAEGACVSCAEDMHRVLADRAEIYRMRFGSEAMLRIAIHCGQVAAGEIGEWKKEIALLGDAMNTTARIEGAARDLGVATVLSDDLVRQLPETIRGKLRRLPDYAAAGKQDPLVLWTPDGA